MNQCPYPLLMLISITIFSAGCSDEKPSENSPDEPIEISGLPPGDVGTVDDHGGTGAHAGPHGGHVIELGRNHEYHAEIVESEDDAVVSVYILDKELNILTLETPNVAINLRVGDEAKSFQLVAKDKETSRFDSDDDSLLADLHNPQASGMLRVIIKGKTYTGDVEHHNHEH